mmetsp:Transcript_10722/g.39724  ORF Transcript_10722/g.39724 Transcript_10722/m.39724 type:complete len:256 (+) Transcript_10722:159-926(+)
MPSMTDLYFSVTTFLLSFCVLVSSLPGTEKSQSRMVNFWIFCALLVASLLYVSIAVWMVFSHTGSFFACDTVVDAALTSVELPNNTSVNPPSVSGSCSCRSVTRHELNLRLSPIIITLEMPGRRDFSLSSIGTGAMFSPPAVMISSLMRPVMPSRLVVGSTFPTSPECNHPSASTVSSVFSALCMYPIITCRPRKQTSPSPGLSLEGSWSILISTPGSVVPHVPLMKYEGLPQVCGPVFSLMPYTSTMLIVSEPK